MNKKHSNQLFRRSTVAVLLLSSLLAGCGEKSMEAHLEDARAYVQKQRVDAAIVEYKNAIQLAPDASEPRFELGKLYLQTNNYVAAEKELNKALELGYPANDVIPILSLAYQQSGAQTALAGVDYKVQGMTAVESAEVGFYKLQALVQLEKFSEAETLLADLMTLDTQSVYKGLIETYQYIIDKDYEAALKATELLRKQAPQNKDVLLQLGRLYLSAGDQQQAINVYQDYTQIYPNDLTSKFAYAALLLEQRELEKAEPIVDELLELNAQHPLLNTFKGIIESANGNYSKALEYLETAIQNGRSDQVVRLVAGFSAYQIQDFEAAQRHLMMVASSLPDNHPGLRMLADSMLQLGENDEALEVLNRVDGVTETDAALFSKASYQLLRQGNVVGARQMVEKTEAVSSSPEDLARLGVLQLSLNDVSGLVNLEAAVEKAPESATSQHTLVRAYVATNQLDKAKQAASNWQKQSPELALPVVYLASIAIAEKDFDHAQSLLERAEKLDGSQNEVVLTKAKLLIAQEKHAEAKVLLKDFLNKNPSEIQAISLWYALEAHVDNADEVIDYAEKQLAADNENIYLRLFLARVYAATDNIEKTVSLLSEVEGDKTTPMAFWNLKGQALIQTNKVEEASALFKRWLELYPQDKGAVLGMLLILDSQNKYRQGLALTDKVLDKHPDPQLSLLKAYFHSMLGQSKPAWSIIDNMSDEARRLPFVRGIIARLYVIDKRPEQALEHAEEAYKASPNSDNAILMVVVLEMLGKKGDALTFLTQHVEKTPNDMRSAMLLAERQIVTNKAQAMSLYESILTKLPDNFVALNNLAYLKFQDGNLVEAEKLAQEAIALQPENADTVDTLAQIYIAKGDQKAALALYSEIATRPIDNDEVYLNYIELLLQMDKVEMAKRLVQEREFESDVSLKRIEVLKADYGI